MLEEPTVKITWGMYSLLIKYNYLVSHTYIPNLFSSEQKTRCLHLNL